MSEYFKDYYRRNRDKRLADSKARRERIGKAAVSEYNKQYAAAHPGAGTERMRKWRAANAQRYREASKQYRALVAERQKLYMAAWLGENRALKAAADARRKAARIQAVPKYVNRFFVAEAYRLAVARTSATGIEWQVDHVVPLLSGLVCGLHTECNLQVIPRSVNASKGNRKWPHMP